MGNNMPGLETNQKKEQAAGPPFAATAADNGLSVDPVTGRIVLGGPVATPSQLLNAREIDLNNFDLRLRGNTSGLLLVDNPLTSDNRIDPFQVLLRDLIQNVITSIFPANIILNQNGVTSNVNIQATTGQAAIILGADTGNGVEPIVAFSDSAAVAEPNFQLAYNAAEGFVARNSQFFGTGNVMRLDKQNGAYQVGDLGATDNGARMEIDDNTATTRFRNTANTMKLNMNGVNGITGVFAAPIASITVNGGIITAIT